MDNIIDQSAHVEEYYEFLAALDWDIACQAMKDAEDRWVDAGCPTNGNLDPYYYDPYDDVNWVGHSIHY